MIVDHLSRIAAAESVHDAWATLADLMAQFGFDRLLYVSTRFRTERSIGDLQDALFLTNHGRDYAHAMIERGLIRHAPMMHAPPGARPWGRPEAASEGRRPTGLGALVAEARARLGMTAGYDVVFREVSSRAWGGIELTARAGLGQDEVDAIWQERGLEIEFLFNLTHLRISHLPSWGGRRPLTRQQRRVLQWVAEGKTAQDVATIMGLTPATVEKHLRLAREALDVQTTAQAVSKAAHWNQLFVEDPLALAG
jgi:LuxR family transcriptional regulator